MRDFTALVLFLSAPKLRELVIVPAVGSDFTYLVPHADLPNGLPRFPALVQLTVAPALYDISGPPLKGASRCFPNIQTLILANPYVAGSEDLQTLFPKMENLALTAVNEEMVRVVQQVAKVRKLRGSPLKNVYVDSNTMATFMSVEGDWEGINVQVADVWENQRKKAMYRNVKNFFI